MHNGGRIRGSPPPPTASRPSEAGRARWIWRRNDNHPRFALFTVERGKEDSKRRCRPRLPTTRERERSQQTASPCLVLVVAATISCRWLLQGCDYSSLEAIDYQTITSTRGIMWAVSPLIWHVCVVRGERGPHAEENNDMTSLTYIENLKLNKL